MGKRWLAVNSGARHAHTRTCSLFRETQTNTHTHTQHIYILVNAQIKLAKRLDPIMLPPTSRGKVQLLLQKCLHSSQTLEVMQEAEFLSGEQQVAGREWALWYSGTLAPDMEFVKKCTPPDFQAKNFTPSISPNFNSFSEKKHKK